MAQRKKHRDRFKESSLPAGSDFSPSTEYLAACRLAEAGEHAEARRLFERLLGDRPNPSQAALLRNDLAVLAALAGDLVAARAGFTAALVANSACSPARVNLAALDGDPQMTGVAPAAQQKEGDATRIEALAVTDPPRSPVPAKVAILSFLFNWPATGGGNIHTAELALFLARAGYDVKHFFARYSPWGIGEVGDPPFPSEALEFHPSEWALDRIKSRFRKVVDEFAPDYVLVTDAWNVKPHLAEAMRGYRTFLRFQALECLCPLNNVRLLALGEGRSAQCPFHQLADPLECFRCLRARGVQSGGLHRAERELSGVGTRAYVDVLYRSLREAEAILVLTQVQHLRGKIRW